MRLPLPDWAWVRATWLANHGEGSLEAWQLSSTGALLVVPRYHVRAGFTRDGSFPTTCGRRASGRLTVNRSDAWTFTGSGPVVKSFICAECRVVLESKGVLD